MQFSFRPITWGDLQQIKEWQYDGVVTGIYVEPYFASHAAGDEQLRGPGGCRGYAVLAGERLIGLFEYYFQDDAIEIGLALAPEAVGQGLGKDFVLQGIHFAIDEFGYDREYVRLSVDVNNHPAIRVYEKAGFIKVGENQREIQMRWYL